MRAGGPDEGFVCSKHIAPGSALPSTFEGERVIGDNAERGVAEARRDSDGAVRAALDARANATQFLGPHDIQLPLALRPAGRCCLCC
jgi:hypothetical protein